MRNTVLKKTINNIFLKKTECYVYYVLKFTKFPIKNICYVSCYVLLRVKMCQKLFQNLCSENFVLLEKHGGDPSMS